MKIARALLLAPLLVACQATYTPQAPSMDTRVPSDLEDLVRIYQEGTGVNVTYDEETRERLAGTPIRAVGGASANTILIGPSAAEGPETTVQFEVLHLEHADARMLSQSLESLLHDAAGGGRRSRVQVLPDVRLNALLIRGPEESLEHLKELVGHLDVEVQEG